MARVSTIHLQQETLIRVGPLGSDFDPVTTPNLGYLTIEWNFVVSISCALSSVIDPSIVLH